MLRRFLDIHKVPVFHVSLLGSATKYVRDREGIEFGPLVSVDFEISELFAEKGRRKNFSARLTEGHRCFGFRKHDGQAVAYLWLSTMKGESGLIPFEGGLRCRIGDREAYIWDCRTDRAFQGHGFYRDGLSQLLEICREEGVSDVFIVSRASNTASTKAILATGFERLYEMRIMIFLNRLRLVFADGRFMIRGAGGLVEF